MAKTHIKTDQTTQYAISTSGNRIILDEGVAITNGAGDAMNEMAGVTDNQITIRGTLAASGILSSALALHGNGTDVEIARSGRLKGELGVALHGQDATLVNHGRIEGSGFAFAVAGNSHIVNHGAIISDDGSAFFTNVIDTLRLDNDGLIRSKDGFDFQVKSLELVFASDSVIEFDTAGAIRTNSQTGWTAIIRNDGTITHDKVGMSSAISGGAGNELVRNTGTMTGFVDLDAGDDRYDGRGGRVIDGHILGGDGNDVYILDNSRDRVHDSVGWGYDKLRVSASYSLGVNNEIEETWLVGKGDFNLKGNSLGNYLIGNRGDNRLVGLAGNDVFAGGAGDDVIIGGDGGDVFYFKPDADREIITDFTDGEDLLIYLGTSAFDTLENLLANHVEQRGDDLVISNNGTEMILRNVDKADLTAADFTA